MSTTFTVNLVSCTSLLLRLKPLNFSLACEPGAPTGRFQMNSNIRFITPMSLIYSRKSITSDPLPAGTLAWDIPGHPHLLGCFSTSFEPRGMSTAGYGQCRLPSICRAAGGIVYPMGRPRTSAGVSDFMRGPPRCRHISCRLPANL